MKYEKQVKLLETHKIMDAVIKRSLETEVLGYETMLILSTIFAEKLRSVKEVKEFYNSFKRNETEEEKEKLRLYVVKHIATLVKNNYISKESDAKDKRIKNIALTKLGEDTLRRWWISYTKHLETFAEHFEKEGE